MENFDEINNAINLIQSGMPTDSISDEILQEANRLLGRVTSVLSSNTQSIELDDRWFSASGDIAPYQWSRHLTHMRKEMGNHGDSIMTKIGIDADRIMDELPDPRPKDAKFNRRGLFSDRPKREDGQLHCGYIQGC